MITSGNIATENDQIKIDILNMKPDPTGAHMKRQAPVRNSMKMSHTDYREFISTFGFTMNWMKKFLNQVEWADGLSFPYDTTEINSTIQFQEK
jgi:hypothetical protein